MNNLTKISNCDCEYEIDFSPYIADFLEDKNLIISIDPRKIRFSADRIESLNLVSDGGLIRHVIYDLSFQILALRCDGKTIGVFDVNDIVVINANIFLFNNPALIYDLDMAGCFVVDKKYSNSTSTMLLSPELLGASIGDRVFYTSIYYSLGMLILYVFDITIERLYYTGEYFFIKKIMNEDPRCRRIMYV